MNYRVKEQVNALGQSSWVVEKAYPEKGGHVSWHTMSTARFRTERKARRASEALEWHAMSNDWIDVL